MVWMRKGAAIERVRQRVGGALHRLRRDKRGNVFVILAFAILPIMTATGMSIDYALAARLQTKMSAAADAAALSGVTQPMMHEANVANIESTVRRMFNAQVEGLRGLNYDASTLVVTVAETLGSVNRRTIEVRFSGTSNNSFIGLLGRDTLPLGGVAQTSATIAPDIDFYVMLDTSPSMAIPATTAGINTMTAKTGGCAFACHQTDVSGGETVVHNGTRMSYYSYARAMNLQLRADLVSKAVEDLANVATDTGSQNGANYRMALSKFSFNYTNIVASPSSPATVKSNASQATILPYCRNNQRVCGTGDDDQATNFTVAFDGALSTLPGTSGAGTGASGDTPKAFLFIVTDGMRDEASGGRRMGPIPTNQCQLIKDRGVKIAILYTEYLASAASDQWSIDNVRRPYLDAPEKISPALTNCASPGLFYKVSTNDNISSALTAMFRQAIATPRLTQ